MDQAESLGTAAGVLTTDVPSARESNRMVLGDSLGGTSDQRRLFFLLTLLLGCWVMDTPCPGHSGCWDATFLSLHPPWASRSSEDLAKWIRKLKTQLILAAHQCLSDAKTNLPYWHIRQYLSVWQQAGYTCEKQDSEKAVTREIGLRWEESDQWCPWVRNPTPGWKLYFE